MFVVRLVIDRAWSREAFVCEFTRSTSVGNTWGGNKMNGVPSEYGVDCCNSDRWCDVRHGDLYFNVYSILVC